MSPLNVLQTLAGQEFVIMDGIWHFKVSSSFCIINLTYKKLIIISYF